MYRDYASALMMWTWQDEQVECHTLLDEALEEMARQGFSGALAMLRGCRYELSDPLVIEAARHAAETARRLNLAFWFALDPRLDQGRLVSRGEPAVYLLPQREAQGALPCEAVVGPDGRYCVRIEYGRPRRQHMLSRVAVTYQPEAVERVFAYRKGEDGRVIAASVKDVTAGARLFVQSAAGYLEIFGRLEGLAGEGWHVLALPRCRSNYPDLGSPATRQALIELYRTYHAAGVRLDGVLWDEIGYVSSYGSDRSRLPYGDHVRREFAARHGADLADLLIWLLLDDDGRRAASVRRDYYAAVQACAIGAQELCYAEARRLWGPGVESGIHQTWHQNANDLPHGSADWWQGRLALSGGYTDVGHAEEWEREEHGAQLLAMAATAVTLARYHLRPMAFCNLWGVNFGEPGSKYPAEIMDWWAHLLSAFGITWLAHTYGPNGYIDTFTNWGPGYPHHPSWERFAAVNRRIRRVREITGGALPEAEVAVVYPLGTMARIGSASANPVAEDAQRTVAHLLRQHLAADLISPDFLARGSVRDGALWLETPRGPQRYGAVVYPHPQTLQPGEVERLREAQAAGVPVVLLGMAPREGTDGRPLDLSSLAGSRLEPIPLATDPAAPWTRSLARAVTAPPGCFARLFRRPDGDLALVIVPSDFGRPVSGTVACGALCLTVRNLGGIAAVRFRSDGAVLDLFTHDGDAYPAGLAPNPA